MKISAFIRIFLLGYSISLAETESFYAGLARRNTGVYSLYRYENGNWTSTLLPYSSGLSIGDFGYDYVFKNFYFTVSGPPENKGIWKLDSSFNFGRSHKFTRSQSKPQDMLLLPEYQLILFYDEGYQSVLAVNLAEKTSSSRFYFDDAEPIGSPRNRSGLKFLVTSPTFELIGLASNTPSVYRAGLDESTSEKLDRPLPDNVTSVLAFANSLMFVCQQNGQLGAFKVNTSLEFVSIDRAIACNGNNQFWFANENSIEFTHSTNGSIWEISYNITNGTLVTGLASEIAPAISDAWIFAIKKYASYKSPQALCSPTATGSMCVPSKDGSPVEVCADFSHMTSSKTCEPDSLQNSTGYILLDEATLPGYTSMQWLLGSRWLHRPIRHFAKSVNSHVLGAAGHVGSQLIYAIESRHRQLFYFSLLDNQVSMTPFNEISSALKSIALDWVGNNVIWYDPAFQWLRIVQITTDSTAIHYKTKHVMHDLEGYSLALDANAGYLFFLDLEDRESKVYIIRTLMDGSGAQKLLPSTFNTTYFDDNIDDNSRDHPLPGALAVDPFGQRLWVAFVNHIFKLDYNGTVICHKPLQLDGFSLNNSRVGGIAVVNSLNTVALVAVNYDGHSRLFVFNISADCVTQLAQLDVHGKLKGLTTFMEFPEPSVDCSAAGCSHICLNMAGKATCVCPDGMKLADGGKLCIADSLHPDQPLMVFTDESKICHVPVGIFAKAKPGSAADFNIVANCLQQNPRGPGDPENLLSDLVPAPLSDSVIYRGTSEKNNSICEAQLWDASTLDCNGIRLRAAETSHGTIIYDDLARNLYTIIDGDIVVIRNDLRSNFPKLILRAQAELKTTAIAIDQIRRHLYRVEFKSSTKEVKIVRSNLAAQNSCDVTYLMANRTVLQMEISYVNNSLLFLTNEEDRGYRMFGEFKLDEISSACDKNEIPEVSYHNITSAVGTVKRFGLFHGQLYLLTTEDKLFTSVTLGVSVEQNRPLSNIKTSSAPPVIASIKHFTILNTAIEFATLRKNSTSGENGTDGTDFCTLEPDCEQMCLASECTCSLGMRLLADGRNCAPKLIETGTNNSWLILAADENHHQLFVITVADGDILKNGTINSTISSMKIHYSARPRSMSYNPIDQKIYYSDAERRSLKSVNMKAQMNYGNFTDVIEETVPGNRFANGLAILTIGSNESFLIASQSKKVDVIALRNGSSKSVLRNDSLDFLGIAVDSRNETPTIYVAAKMLSMSAIGPLIVYKIRLDGTEIKPPLIFHDVVPPSASPTYAELALDLDRNRIFVSIANTIISKDLKDSTPTSWRLTLATSSTYYGLQVVGNRLLASDRAGGIDVLDATSGLILGRIGQRLFHGLHALYAFQERSIALPQPAAATTPTTTTKAPTTSTSTTPSTTSTTSTTSKTSTSTTTSTSKTSSTSTTSTTTKTTTTARVTKSPTTSSTTTKSSTTSARLTSETSSKSTTPNASTLAASEGQSGQEKSSANVGIWVGIVIAIAVLAGLTIGLIIYCRKRPGSRGFSRLEGGGTNMDRYLRMEDEGFDNAGSLGFHNPMYGVEGVSDRTARNQPAASSNRHGLDIFSELEGGL